MVFMPAPDPWDKPWDSPWDSTSHKALWPHKAAGRAQTFTVPQTQLYSKTEFHRTYSWFFRNDFKVRAQPARASRGDTQKW